MADGMVRGAEGAGADQRAGAVQCARDRIDAGDFERFGQGRRRQNRRQGARHQSFAAARRAYHAHIVVAGAGDFESAFGVFLPADVLEIDRVDDLLTGAERGCALGRNLLLPGEMGDHITEVDDREYVDAFDQLGLGCVGLGHEHAPVTGLLGHRRHRQRAVYVAHRAIQTQFADHQRVFQIGQDLAGCGHDTERDGQIVCRAFFAQVGGRQIDGESMFGKEKAAVGDCGTNAFAALAYGGIG